MLEDILFVVLWIICMFPICLFNPVIWQALRNSRYVDKLKKERDREREREMMAMPDIPEPDGDDGQEITKK